MENHYRHYLNGLTNFELFDEMMRVSGLDYVDAMTGHTLWSAVEDRCITDELALVASTMKQKYRYELKDK